MHPSHQTNRRHVRLRQGIHPPCCRLGAGPWPHDIEALPFVGRTPCESGVIVEMPGGRRGTFHQNEVVVDPAEVAA